MGSLTKERSAERLRLVEPSSNLWRRIRETLAELRQEEEGKTPALWAMGGGSVLAARWQHRRSTDVDLVTSASWQLRNLEEKGTNSFTKAMTALGGELKGFNEASIEMSFPNGEQLHIFKHAPEPGLGHRRAIIDDQPFVALSTTQILAGKLLYRSVHAPARDLYDIVLASKHEPESLRQAVNMLPPKRQSDITFMWHIRHEKIERYARATLKPISEQKRLIIPSTELVKQAVEATEAASYQEIRVIPARAEEAAVIVTTTADGTTTPISVPYVFLDEVLEQSALNHCLAARNIDSETFISSLHTERETPPQIGGNPRVPTPPIRPSTKTGPDLGEERIWKR